MIPAGTLNRTYSYDAAGNTTSDGLRTFTFSDAGRMTSATHLSNTTSYQYNALGQRVFKSNGSGSIYFVYDEAGHLLGEYDQSGNLVQELVYLGDIPVATIRTDQGGSGAGVFYIHTDHLNTPAKVTRPSDNQVIWRWDHDPYGNGVPNQDPDGNGLQLTMNLRFPGQYYDSETGLLYNWHRYYDPTTGRYISSDPIGLKGGTNTYSYAMGNPVMFIDPSGTNVTMTCRPLRNFLGAGGTLKHCGVVVWHWSNDCPRKKVIDFQFSTPGWSTSPTRDPNDETYGDDRSAFFNPGGDNTNYDIPVPSTMNSSEFDSAVINSGNSYDGGFYWPTGPNSNTAATQIITGAGGTAPAAPFALGQFWPYSSPDSTIPRFMMETP